MRFKFLLLLGLLCLLHSTILFANEKLSIAPKPNWLRALTGTPVTPNLDEISEGYYFELVDRQVHLGLQTTYDRSIRVLFDQAGADGAGQINVSFDPSYQKLVFHEIKIIRDGKEINRLDLKNFKVIAQETELSRSIYNGMQSAFLVVDDLRKDDKLIVAYSIVGFNPVFLGKFAEQYALQAGEPIGLLHLHYYVPNGRKLKFKSHNNAPLVQGNKFEDHKSYHWELAASGLSNYEYNTPGWYTQGEWVECSEYESWDQVIDWVNKVNPIKEIELGSPLSQHVEKLWTAAGKKREKYIELACNFVQNDVRYMGIEIGQYSHRASDPEKVFKQRYGDCKDKSVLLATMLQAKQIQSALLLANTEKSIISLEQLPSPMAFNHMVMMYRGENRYYHIDPTISNQGGPIEQRAFPFYGDMLEILPDGDISRIGPPQNSRIEIFETIKLVPNDEATLTVKSLYTGLEADRMRNEIKTAAKNATQKSYLAFYKEKYKNVSSLGGIRYEDDFKNNQLIIHERYKITKISQYDEEVKKRFIPVINSHVADYIPSIDDDRFAPVAVNYPIDITHEIAIINLNNTKIYHRPITQFNQRKAYRFGSVYKTSQDTLKITYKLAFTEEYLAQEDFETFKQDFSKKDEIFSVGYYLNEDGTLAIGNQFLDLNVWAILSFLVVAAMIISIIYIVYHSTTPQYLKPDPLAVQHSSIDGLLILLAMVIPFIIFANLFHITISSNFFQNSTWVLSDYKAENKYLVLIVLSFDFLVSTFEIVGWAYVLILFLTRRDIFPQTMLGLIIISFIAFLISETAHHYVYDSEKSQTDSVRLTIVKLIIFGLIGAYLMYSSRVKGTFNVAWKEKG
ncbi:DUF3857 domain-containing transglutaminase family protein [Sphingobacterium hotanense]|uniref:DUF3857 domain-containing transglutaminase family protein n=1 Tax=Sphingobacterium hotanense TaxID=649196 RepID=UPI0021A77F9A|nr:DUF3857 domain-containing transglutaminase family protein [Sphingobacterium hotanense]MCT1523316.1 DUF3857 domain-containing transglutaminase family protein [Sphingobacterium hotanense]